MKLFADRNLDMFAVTGEVFILLALTLIINEPSFFLHFCAQELAKFSFFFLFCLLTNILHLLLASACGMFSLWCI